MITTAIGQVSDIEGVLRLQEKYLFRNMSAEERKRGFVTTPFTHAQVEKILDQNGLFIAKDQEHQVVAYVFAADWDYFSQWEIFNYMVSRFPQMLYRGKEISKHNTFQYGPICIDIPFRGSGLMKQITEEMRMEFVKRFPISLTFINGVNEVSTRAHKKVGWEIIDEFKFNDNNYITLALDMQKSVLK